MLPPHIDPCDVSLNMGLQLLFIDQTFLEVLQFHGQFPALVLQPMEELPVRDAQLLSDEVDQFHAVSAFDAAAICVASRWTGYNDGVLQKQRPNGIRERLLRVAGAAG